VLRYCGRSCAWYDVLAIGGRKTLTSFLDRAGFAEKESVPDLRTFLANQQFIDNVSLLVLLL
jgi:hypothetical protein